MCANLELQSGSVQQGESAVRCALLDSALWCILLCLFLLLGCAAHPQIANSLAATTENADPTQISAEHAQTIAKREVEKTHKGDIEVYTPELVQGAYWRVIIESGSHDPKRYVTNVCPAVASRERTEAMALEQAKTELHETAPKVQSAELIQGPFWRVLVEDRPGMPEGFVILDISLKDGTVVFSFQ